LDYCSGATGKLHIENGLRSAVTLFNTSLFPANSTREYEH
jgi:hypothetical protein